MEYKEALLLCALMLSRKKIAFSTWSFLNSVFPEVLRYITTSLQIGG